MPLNATAATLSDWIEAGRPEPPWLTVRDFAQERPLLAHADPFIYVASRQVVTNSMFTEIPASDVAGFMEDLWRRVKQSFGVELTNALETHPRAIVGTIRQERRERVEPGGFLDVIEFVMKVRLFPLPAPGPDTSFTLPRDF